MVIIKVSRSMDQFLPMSDDLKNTFDFTACCGPVNDKLKSKKPEVEAT
jgi:hypothetical protein